MLRQWYTRDHLSAISAISPEGKLHFHAQDHAMDSADVVAFLEHLLREVPGRMIIIWDGAPIHRSHRIKTFLSNGAAQRMHLYKTRIALSGLNWHPLANRSRSRRQPDKPSCVLYRVPAGLCP